MNKSAKILFFLCWISLISVSQFYSYAQVEDPGKVKLEEKFDELSFKWDYISEQLKEYEGLSAYCVDQRFRKEVIYTLKAIHHYDTLIYNRLWNLSLTDSNKEIRKTLKQIEEFESHYSLQSFQKYLSIECKSRRSLEKEKAYRAKDIGENSYSGQKLVVENTIMRYLNHVTYLVDHIRKHLDHLHIDDVYVVQN